MNFLSNSSKENKTSFPRPTPHATNFNYFDMTEFYTPIIATTTNVNDTNPGIALPLSFVRRFLTTSELRRVNAWFKENATAGVLADRVEGEVRERSGGVCGRREYEPQPKLTFIY